MRRIWTMIGALVGLAIVGIDFSIVFTSLAEIQKSLDISVTNLQWIPNIFCIFLTAFLVTAGRLADTFGRKRLYILGLLIFGLGTLCAGLSVDVPMLLIGRSAQGVGTAIVLPVSQGIMSGAFPGEKRAKAIGIWTMFNALSLASGPVFGGIILSFASWRWIFFVTLPFVITSLIITLFAYREPVRERRHEKIDWLGMALLFILIGSLSLAIVQGPDWGWLSGINILFYCIAVVSTLVLFAIERKMPAPILNPSFFLNRNFISAVAALFAMMAMIWTSFFLIPLALQNMYLFSSFNVGLMMLLITVPVFLFSTSAGKAIKRWSGKGVVSLGLILLISSALFQMWAINSSMLSVLAIGMVLLGLGWCFTWGPATTVGVMAESKELAALAAGAVMTVQDIGAVLGLAIGGSLFRAVGMNKIVMGLKSQHLSLDVPLENVLSNPHSVKSRPVFEIVKNAFENGYSVTMWFLIGIAITALIATCSMMKRDRSQ